MMRISSALAILLAAVALVRCEAGVPPAPPPSPPPPRASSPPVVPSPLPPAPGSTVARGPGGELVLADGSARALWQIDPGDLTRAHVPLDGPPAQLATVGDEVLVAVGAPSELLWLAPDAALGLVVQRRIALPAGASGLAVSADGATAYVASSEAASVSAVDLATGRLRWTAEVAAHPIGLALDARGDTLYVQHAHLGAPSRLTGLAAARPTVVGPEAAGGLVTAMAARRGQGLLVATAGRQGPALSSLDGEPAPRLPLAEVGRARAIVARPSDGHLLVLGERALVEVDGGRVVASYPTSLGHDRCQAPSGLTLSADGATAFLACRGGVLGVVDLGGAGPPRLHALDTRPPEGCAEPGDTPVSAQHARRFLGADAVERVVRAYHCRHPGETELLELGTTHQGRTMLALAIGRDVHLRHDKPTLFLNGGHHGSELLSTSFALDAIGWLLEHQSDAEVARWLDELVIVVAPLVNPDGNWFYTEKRLFGRKNGRDNNGDGQRAHREGVDINRNYPFRWGTLGEAGSSTSVPSKYYRGTAPASEPETQAVMRLADREHFPASVSFHTGTLALLVPYTIPKVNGPTPDVAMQVAEHIVAMMPPHPEGPVPIMRRLYPIDGCDQDWLRHTHGTVALLMEGADDWLVHLEKRLRMIEVVRRSWAILANRLLDGPSVSGRVVDAAGEPLVAEVMVREITYREGERWTSRCRDGRFDRLLPGPGSYTLDVRVPGQPPVSQRVDVAGGRVEVEIELPVRVTRPARCDAEPVGDGQVVVALP